MRGSLDLTRCVLIRCRGAPVGGGHGTTPHWSGSVAAGWRRAAGRHVARRDRCDGRLGRAGSSAGGHLGGGQGRAGLAALGAVPRAAVGGLARSVGCPPGGGARRSGELSAVPWLRGARADARAHGLRAVSRRAGAAPAGPRAVRGGHAPTRWPWPRGQGRHAGRCDAAAVRQHPLRRGRRAGPAIVGASRCMATRPMSPPTKRPA